MKKYKSLAAWRQGEKLDQVTAAKMIGITQASFSRIERRVFSPRPMLALKIEEVTGVPKEKIRPDIFKPKREHV